MGTREQARERRRARLAAVVIAVLAPLAIWTVAELVFHIHLRAPDGFGGDIGAQNVILASAFLSFAGWGLLVLLERLTARARSVWMTVAVVVLIVSLVTPLSGTGIALANRAVLELMHLAVGAVLIPGLYRTCRARGERRPWHAEEKTHDNGSPRRSLPPTGTECF